MKILFYLAAGVFLAVWASHFTRQMRYGVAADTEQYALLYEQEKAFY